MKIFITGATGYVGGLLATKLADSGQIVHALVRNPRQAAELNHPNIKLFAGDLSNINSIKYAMDGCDQVFHLAAYARLWAKPVDVFYKTNVDGTRNVLEAALEKRITKLVYTSSTAVFGTSFDQPLSEEDPRTIGFNNDYDLSKCMAEKLVKEYAANGLNAVIVNPSRIYGPGKNSFSNPFTRLLIATLRGKPVLVPKCPRVIANYSYIDDVIQGHLLAMENGKRGEKYILGGENISYREFLDAVGESTPVRNVIQIPKPVLKIMAVLQLMRFYFTRKLPAFTPSTIDRYYANTMFSCEKAIHELGYRITPFKEGISKTILHLKNNRS